jgi:HEAT repeat protein
VRICFLTIALIFAGGVFASAAAPRSAFEDLKSADPSRQERARRELRTYRYKDISDPMEDFAADPNPEVRILMAQVIGELGGMDASRALRRLFKKEREPRVRRALLIQLAGRLSAEDAADFFSGPALSDSDAELRYLSLNQLSLIGNEPGPRKTAEKVFRKALKSDASALNRRSALVALCELGDPPKDAEPELLAALQDPALELRRRSAALLGKLRSREAFEKMAVAARDADAQVRSNLCQSLGETGDPAAVPLLTSLTYDKDPQVRKAAFLGLCRFPDGPVGSAVFVRGLQDPDAQVRSASAEWLERATPQPEVLQALRSAAAGDPDPSVQFLARKALATLGQKR